MHISVWRAYPVHASYPVWSGLVWPGRVWLGRFGSGNPSPIYFAIYKVCIIDLPRIKSPFKNASKKRRKQTKRRELSPVLPPPLPPPLSRVSKKGPKLCRKIVSGKMANSSNNSRSKIVKLAILAFRLRWALLGWLSLSLSLSIESGEWELESTLVWSCSGTVWRRRVCVPLV